MIDNGTRIENRIENENENKKSSPSIIKHILGSIFRNTLKLNVLLYYMMLQSPFLIH